MRPDRPLDRDEDDWLWFTLDDAHELVQASLADWVIWMAEDPTRRIVRQTQAGEAWVSTVFLGLNLHGNLFETAVFREGDEGAEILARSASWADAEEMHARAVESYTARL